MCAERGDWWTLFWMFLGAQYFRMDIRIQGTISFCSLSTIFWILFLLSQRLTQQYQSKFQGETQHQWMYSLLCTKVFTSYSSFNTLPVQLMLPHTKICNCKSRPAQFCICTVRPIRVKRGFPSYSSSWNVSWGVKRLLLWVQCRYLHCISICISSIYVLYFYLHFFCICIILQERDRYVIWAPDVHRRL